MDLVDASSLSFLLPISVLEGLTIRGLRLESPRNLFREDGNLAQ